MYLIPIIRTGRAISACCLFPEYPIYAISASEILSYSIPFIRNSKTDTDIIIFTLLYFFKNEYAQQLIQQFKKRDLLFYQIELYSIILFLIYYIVLY